MRIFCAIFLYVSVYGREISSFNENWLFQLGDTGYAPPCDTSTFTTNLSNIKCAGSSTIFVSTRELCEEACCTDPNCKYWQYCDPSEPCVPAQPAWGCNHGYDDCATKEGGGTNWTGSLRTTPTPPPKPPSECIDSSLPCSPSFVDTSWRDINVPHDFIVEGSYSEHHDKEHGFLPFNISWYRKHFTLDPKDAGSVVWLEFDGVYKNSDIWLNGHYLGHQTSGYVAFRYFLHNLTVSGKGLNKPILRYDGENVISVRVDALSTQEGWWYEGGGIYRPVTLNVVDPLYIQPMGVYLPSSVIGQLSLYVCVCVREG